MTRNVVPPESAEHNRVTPGGGPTFNAFPPDDYEGVLFVAAALRLGDHAHVEVSSGWHTPQKHGVHPSLHYGRGGLIVLRWHEWVKLRDEVLDLSPMFRIAEVENPTDGQLKHHGVGG